MSSRVDNMAWREYIDFMPWTTVLVPKFEDWLNLQDVALIELIVRDLKLLEQEGPFLGRPKVDTLSGSKILLGGNITNDHRWYVKNIRIAEKRFAEYKRNEEEN